MRTRPSDGSSRRGIISTSVDLPAPVRPTTPSICPASSEKLTPSSTSGASPSLPLEPFACSAGRFSAGPPSALLPAAVARPFPETAAASPFSPGPSASSSASSSVGAPVACDASGALSAASPFATACPLLSSPLPRFRSPALPFSETPTTSSSERCPNVSRS